VGKRRERGFTPSYKSQRQFWRKTFNNIVRREGRRGSLSFSLLMTDDSPMITYLKDIKICYFITLDRCLFLKKDMS
jgi:hypothetical protein